MTAAPWHPFDIIIRVLAARLDGREPSVELRAALVSPAVDWEGVVGEASCQYVLAAFAAALRDLKLSDPLEPNLREFLAAVYAANVERNRHLHEQLREVVATLNGIGVEPVLLKGAIRLVDGLYPETGWRMMRDLDILVPQTGFAHAIEALRGLGYDSEQRPIEAIQRDWRGGHPGRLALLELHKELFGARQQRLLKAANVIEGSEPAAVGGAKARLPLLEHQITHLIGHSQVFDGGYAYGRIELRDRLEGALLLRSAGDGLAWETLLERFAAAGHHRPLLSFLLSLHDGALCTLPVRAHIDRATRLQRWRIALQARSAAMTRVGWYALQFKKQIMTTDRGWPTIVRTLKELVAERGTRRVLLGKLARGPRLR